MLIRPQINELTAELTAIVAQQPGRRAALGGEPIEHIHHVLSAETLAHLNRQALSREYINHGQGAKPLPIHQLIGHKVQSPGVIWSCHRWPMGSDDHGFPPLWWPMTECQAFFAVETVHKVLPHGPAFSIEEHPNLPVVVPSPRLGQLPDGLPERGAGVAMTAIAIAGPRTADSLAGAPLTDRIRRAQIAHHAPLLRGPYHFARTSWSITLSRENSATNRFSLAFSSWSCLNSRNCSDSSPA